MGKSSRSRSRSKSKRSRACRGKSKCIGTKSAVWRGFATKTAGGLTKHDLMKNKFGKIVSKRKHALGLKRYRSLSKAAKAAWKRNSSKYGK